MIRIVTTALCFVFLTACNSSSSSSSNSVTGNQCPASSSSGLRWLTAWGGTRETDAQQGTGPAPIETTVRNVVRVSVGGNRVRLRFFNEDDTRPITIAAASLGLRDGGAMLKANSVVPVTFNCGRSSVVIPPNTTSLESDPIEFRVANQDDLAISLHIVGEDNPPEFSTAWNESYKLPNNSGNEIYDESGENFSLIDDRPGQVPPGTPLVCNGCRPYALHSVDVLTDEAVGVMTFLGSSSFHGYNTSQDQFRRVSDLLSVRMLNEIDYGKRHAIVTRAIGGDTLEAASRDRMEKDIWSTTGISSVVVWVTNDLSSRTADEVIENYRSVITQAHARGINVFCPTWIPGAQSSQANLNGERAKLNDWIRNSGECDGVVDYNAAVEAPGGITFLPQYNSGDSIHSNDAGHQLWSDITPLAQWIASPAPAN